MFTTKSFYARNKMIDSIYLQQRNLKPQIHEKLLGQCRFLQGFDIHVCA